MKRMRLSTLMLLIVIAAMGVALVVQGRRATRRETELAARNSELEDAAARAIDLVEHLRRGREENAKTAKLINEQIMLIKRNYSGVQVR